MPKSPVGIKARFPGFIELAATLIGRSPKGARWIHEIKFDGYRVQVHLANAAVKVFTRRGNIGRSVSTKSLRMRGTLQPVSDH